MSMEQLGYDPEEDRLQLAMAMASRMVDARVINDEIDAELGGRSSGPQAPEATTELVIAAVSALKFLDKLAMGTEEPPRRDAELVAERLSEVIQLPVTADRVNYIYDNLQLIGDEEATTETLEIYRSAERYGLRPSEVYADEALYLETARRVQTIDKIAAKTAQIDRSMGSYLTMVGINNCGRQLDHKMRLKYPYLTQAALQIAVTAVLYRDWAAITDHVASRQESLRQSAWYRAVKLWGRQAVETFETEYADTMRLRQPMFSGTRKLLEQAETDGHP